MSGIKTKAKVIIAAVFFAAVSVAGCLIERFDHDAFIEEAVVSEEAVYYVEENGDKSVGLININTADTETLAELYGIGGALAERIVDYRENHGGFGVIEEIMNVPGISEIKFGDIKDDICVD